MSKGRYLAGVAVLLVMWMGTLAFLAMLAFHAH